MAISNAIKIVGAVAVTALAGLGSFAGLKQLNKKKVTPELRIAVFGQSGSGKTTLLASYYGNQQSNRFETDLGYRLCAEDAEQGNSLLARYYKLRAGSFPLGTDEFQEYRFDLKVGALAEPGLKIAWYDYPGGWWERAPKDPAEVEHRTRAFQKLLSCHFGMLVVDAEKYLEDGIAYIRQVLDQFKNEIRRISERAQAASPAEAMPTQWVIAVLKSDRLPNEITASILGEEIVREAVDQINGIIKAVNGIEAGGASPGCNLGNQYLRLAAVTGEGTKVISAQDHIGLQIIAPVALVSMMEEIALRAGKSTKAWGATLLADGVSKLAHLIEKFPVSPKLQKLRELFAHFKVKDYAGKGADYFREVQRTATKKGNAIRAIAMAMRAELAQSGTPSIYHRIDR